MKIGYDYGRLVTGQEQHIELNEEVENTETTDDTQVVPDPLEERTMVATSAEVFACTFCLSQIVLIPV